MNLRPPTVDENGVPSARFPARRHSRAGGNPGSFSVPVALDTRFRGYDGISESNGPLYSGFFHHPAGIFEGAHEEPSALSRNRRSIGRTHRRYTEIAEFGVLLHTILFSAYCASPR
jgi:hypothetical protein